MNLSLYSIKSEYLFAFKSISEIDNITPAEIEDSLAALDCRFDDKAIAVASYIKNLESEAEAMRAYEDNMRARRRICESKIDYLKKYLRSNLMDVGKKKVESAEITVSLREGVGALVVEPINLLPDEFFNVKQLKTVDKNRVKEAIENGAEFEGVRIEKSPILVIK